MPPLGLSICLNVVLCYVTPTAIQPDDQVPRILRLTKLKKYHLTWTYCFTSFNTVQLGELRFGCKWDHVAMARKKASLDSVIPSDNESAVEKKATRSPKT
ncbi:hypothetical protein RJT34_31642 [Clitoria ternatea]|uniref:Secreted protein n=1 Tax=Clitoria ternatea TaxID=43366 RepID=A0AAN9I558_CLITE